MTDIGFYVGEGVETSRSKLFEYLKRKFNFKNLFTTHNSQFTKAIAFTLAETLIVMGIIGVVAALTLPNLNSSTGDREKVAKVKKIYQNLTDALGRAEAVYGPVDEWFVNDSDENKVNRFADRLTEFMKIQKNCGYTQTDGACWTVGASKFINGNNLYIGTGNFYKFITADGTAIAIQKFVASDYANGLMFNTQVDIDGTNKGKNTLGVDIFSFQLNKNITGKFEYYPSYLQDIGDDTTFKDKCWKSDGGACSTWVITNGNMDYLKLDSSGKCKNNTSITLDWATNTTCK